jgi:uncharacterized protein YdeI (YjbR/CyaY-like superfamily)
MAAIMCVMADLPENSVHPKTLAQWRRWLEKHHERTEGVWLVTFKKSTGKPRVEYDEAVEEALCWGWIDSRTRSLDDERGMLWMAPRKPRTGWSATNKARVAKLLREGRFAAAGLAKVKAAKRDGSWTLLDSVEAMEVPDDLAAALKASRGRDYFDGFPRGVRKQLLEWVRSAKKPETRAKRVAEIARLAAMNIRANQWMKKPQDSTST